MTYANGLAPDSALVFINGIHVVPSIAPRVQAFIAYAHSQGHQLYVVARYGGYRQRRPLTPEQEAVYAAGATGGSTVKVAKPGISTHGDYDTGRVDLGDLPTGYTKAGLAWIVANAARFGLSREFGTADPNHFMSVGSFASIGSTTIDNSPAKKGKKMQLFKDQTGTNWLVAEDRGAFVIPDQEHADMVFRVIYGEAGDRAALEYVIGLLNSAPWFGIDGKTANTVDTAAITTVVENAVKAGLTGLVSDDDLTKAQSAILAAIPTGFTAITPAKPQ